MYMYQTGLLSLSDASPRREVPMGQEDDDNNIPSSSSSIGTCLSIFKDHKELLFELALAIYFLVDSIHLFRKWRKTHDDIDGEILEALLNTFGYSYQLWKLSSIGIFHNTDTSNQYEMIV